MKPFIKRDERSDGRTHAQTDIGHFIISRPGPIGRREIKILTVINRWTDRGAVNGNKLI